MSSSITRTPSVALIHDSFVDYKDHPTEARRACQDRLEKHLATGDALARGRRLFDLARQVSVPAPAPAGAAEASVGAASTEVPALPGNLPDVRSYLPVAREVVELIVRTVDAKSPIFQLARAATQYADIEGLVASIIAAGFSPVFSALAEVQVDTSHLADELKGVLADCFLAEDMTFKYASHLSPETLQVLASEKAETFGRGMTHMRETLEAKLPEIMAMLMDAAQTAAQPLEPLSPEDQAKYDRMEAWLNAMSPELLGRLDGLAATSPDGAESGAELVGVIKRELVMLMAEAMADFDLDELAAFHRSPAGLELKAKELLLAPDQENGLLQAQIQSVLQPYVDAGRAAQQAQAEAQMRLVVGTIQQLGLTLPEDPEERAAFLEQVMRLLPMLMQQAPQD